MIVGTFTKIPKKPNSHSYGWARTWSENLGVELDHNNGVHDKVYLLHGANFAGALNLFGGFTDELKQSVDNLMQAKEIVSLDIPMPDYGGMLAKRKDVTDKEWCEALTQKLSTAQTLVSSDLPFSHLAVGDSHTAAVAPPNSSVVKQDGTTLFGQIRADFEYIRSHIKPHHKSITLSLGNIDVRHHICRLDADVHEMVDSYVEFVRELESNGLVVEVAALWPVEFEGRKLPKTGYFHGEPFYGSREERMEVVESIIELLRTEDVNVVQCPHEWYEMDPEHYARTIMEQPQSVHLSPEYYRRMNWGQPQTSLEAFF